MIDAQRILTPWLFHWFKTIFVRQWHLRLSVASTGWIGSRLRSLLFYLYRISPYVWVRATTDVRQAAGHDIWLAAVLPQSANSGHSRDSCVGLSCSINGRSGSAWEALCATAHDLDRFQSLLSLDPTLVRLFHVFKHRIIVVITAF